MQAGLRKIKIEDVTVIVKQDCDDFEALQARVGDAWPKDEKTAQETMREIIVEATRKVEGLTDELGEPITDITTENVRKQGADFIFELFKRMCSPGGGPMAVGGGSSAAG